MSCPRSHRYSTPDYQTVWLLQYSISCLSPLEPAAKPQNIKGFLLSVLGWAMSNLSHQWLLSISAGAGLYLACVVQRGTKAQGRPSLLFSKCVGCVCRAVNIPSAVHHCVHAKLTKTYHVLLGRDSFEIQGECMESTQIFLDFREPSKSGQVSVRSANKN